MPDYTFEQIMAGIPSAFQADQAAGIDAQVQLIVDGNDTWLITIRNQTCVVTQEKAASPRLTLSASKADLMDIFTGKLDGMKAVMSGRMRIQGDIGLAMKFGALFKSG